MTNYGTNCDVLWTNIVTKKPVVKAVIKPVVKPVKSKPLKINF